MCICVSGCMCVRTCVCVCACAIICLLFLDFFFACAYGLSLMTYAVCCDVLFCSFTEEGRSSKILFCFVVF
jgi:hypothetical protein